MATLALIERPEIADALINAVHNGVPVTRAVRLAGVSYDAYNEWQAVANGSEVWPSTGTPVSQATKDKIRHLFGLIAHARDECAAEVVGKIKEAALAANAKTGIPEWRAGAWLLNNHPSYRQEWHEHRELSVEAGGTVTVEHRMVRSMSDQQLLEIAAEDAPDAHIKEE